MAMSFIPHGLAGVIVVTGLILIVLITAAVLTASALSKREHPVPEDGVEDVPVSYP